ncbi:tetratricopeptide repeat protein [Desulfosporosinus nitroreducens]|uniref:tetratricopeptide repeat protein n=1 Tax=Desulfosporosinus nitroreducens TaxID=2018668 RepID=UPI00207CD477|nr:hypothetical protein [Desulfosporosinus nitroreducens]MCO1600025.1 hypothetical protein [Desulfosporosinus nitroreducens]
MSSKPDFNVTSLMGLIRILFPDDSNNYDSFNSSEKVVPLLEYAKRHKDKLVAENTDTDKKYLSYLDFFLVCRMKELYCANGMYKECLEMEAKKTSGFFERLIRDQQIKQDHIPFILNHLICSTNLGVLDDQLIKVVQLLEIDELSIFPYDTCIELTDEDNQRRFMSNYPSEKIVNVLISFYKVLSRTDLKILNKWCFSIAHLFNETIQLFNGEEPKEVTLSNELIEDMKQLQLIESKNILHYNLLDFYINLGCLYLKDESEIFAKEYENYNSNIVINSFIKIFESDSDIELSQNIKLLNTLIKDFKETIRYSYEIEYIKTLIDIYKNNKFAQTHKDIFRSLIYDTSLIESIYELKEYEIICTLYFENKEKVNMDEHFFEIAYSLNERGYSKDAKMAYEYGIRIGKGCSATNNNLGLIYEKEDLGKSYYFFEKSLQKDPKNERAKTNLARVKGLVQKAQSANKKDIFVSTAIDYNNKSQRKIAIVPSVFSIPDRPVQNDLVSVMMPFASSFNQTYSAIKESCSKLTLQCYRADDLWKNSTFIQDIFELIFCSKIVVVDFTGKNPNVFYEVGIAHTLGKIVIPISQSIDDIPSDLKNHRVLIYLPNKEGMQDLTNGLSSRLDTVINGHSWSKTN